MEKLDKNILISIIMPAYNVEKYIEASIMSVINQTYQNWELIVIDDGSTDATASIVANLKNKDHRITYLYQTNSKQAIARNIGISAAKGSILAFLDSDDLWLPNKLQLSLDSFDTSKYDLIFTNSFITSEEYIDIKKSDFTTMKISDQEFFGKEGLKEFIKGNRIPILTVLVQKSVVIEVGLFDTNCVPAEDYDLWLRLLIKGYKFKAIALPLSIYRIQENSSTSLDRFATVAVMKSLSKNFSREELKTFDVAYFLKRWIIRWIDFCLNEHNIAMLKHYIYCFNLGNISIRVLILLHNFLGFDLFKRILRKLLKS